MMMKSAKFVIPGLLGLLVTLMIVGWWVLELGHLSFRTGGTVFNKYDVTIPSPPKTGTADVFWCDEAYGTRWTGCSLQVKK